MWSGTSSAGVAAGKAAVVARVCWPSHQCRAMAVVGELNAVLWCMAAMTSNVCLSPQLSVTVVGTALLSCANARHALDVGRPFYLCACLPSLLLLPQPACRH
jgi:hypothetical protein